MTADEFETYIEEAVACTAERDDLIAMLRRTVTAIRAAEVAAA